VLQPPISRQAANVSPALRFMSLAIDLYMVSPSGLYSTTGSAQPTWQTTLRALFRRCALRVRIGQNSKINAARGGQRDFRKKRASEKCPFLKTRNAMLWFQFDTGNSTILATPLGGVTVTVNTPESVESVQVVPTTSPVFGSRRFAFTPSSLSDTE